MDKVYKRVKRPSFVSNHGPSLFGNNNSSSSNARSFRNKNGNGDHNHDEIGRGDGRGGGGKPTTTHRSIKNRIRAIKRLLAKPDLPKAAVKDKSRLIAKLQEQLKEQEISELEKKYAERYHRIKFFERRKAERRLRKAENVLKSVQDKWKQTISTSTIDEEIQTAQTNVEQALDDVHYIKWYPKHLKYISLYATKKQSLDPSFTERLQAIRRWTRANAVAHNFLPNPPQGDEHIQFDNHNDGDSDVEHEDNKDGDDDDDDFDDNNNKDTFRPNSQPSTKIPSKTKHSDTDESDSSDSSSSSSSSSNSEKPRTSTRSSTTKHITTLSSSSQNPAAITTTTTLSSASASTKNTTIILPSRPVSKRTSNRIGAAHINTDAIAKGKAIDDEDDIDLQRTATNSKKQKSSLASVDAFFASVDDEEEENDETTSTTKQNNLEINEADLPVFFEHDDLQGNELMNRDHNGTNEEENWRSGYHFKGPRTSAGRYEREHLHSKRYRDIAAERTDTHASSTGPTKSLLLMNQRNPPTDAAMDYRLQKQQEKVNELSGRKRKRAERALAFEQTKVLGIAGVLPGVSRFKESSFGTANDTGARLRHVDRLQKSIPSFSPSTRKNTSSSSASSFRYSKDTNNNDNRNNHKGLNDNRNKPDTDYSTKNSKDMNRTKPKGITPSTPSGGGDAPKHYRFVEE